VSLLEASDALHERVRRFASGESAENFAALALAIASFQAEASPGFARLVASRGAPLDRLSAVPAVPVTAFRLTRVAVHGPEHDVARFFTSGTTGASRGMHAFRTTETYRALALRSGTRALVNSKGPRIVACLAPAPEPGATDASSLAFMMRLFASAWDGRALSGGTFDELEPGRWLVQGDRIDLEGLERAAATARARGEPLVVLATAFALVALLDSLSGSVVEAPPGSVVMVTGGYKGRARSIEKTELRHEVARTLGVPATHVVGEYGMTELSSQLYEGTLPGAELRGAPDVFLEPPWLSVTPVDPVTLEPVRPGEVGIARIVDLGNVDSAVAIQTDDLVRRVKNGMEEGLGEEGVEIVGRREGAEPRGCSLALEALLA
jgi:hypothetical protein